MDLKTTTQVYLRENRCVIAGPCQSFPPRWRAIPSSLAQFELDAKKQSWKQMFAERECEETALFWGLWSTGTSGKAWYSRFSTKSWWRKNVQWYKFESGPVCRCADVVSASTRTYSSSNVLKQTTSWSGNQHKQTNKKTRSTLRNEGRILFLLLLKHWLFKN